MSELGALQANLKASIAKCKEIEKSKATEHKRERKGAKGKQFALRLVVEVQCWSVDYKWKKLLMKYRTSHD